MGLTTLRELSGFLFQSVLNLAGELMQFLHHAGAQLVKFAENFVAAAASVQDVAHEIKDCALATARAAETAAIPDADNPPGEAVFVLLTQRFPGADRGVLDAIASAWFEHSGLYPALATVDVTEQTLTFFKAVNVKDLPQAIRITADGVSRALSEVELGEVVPSDGYVVDVSREHAWW